MFLPPGENGAEIEYYRAIEDRFAALRGVPHTLSPKDFQLMRRWWSDQVPLAAVTCMMPYDRSLQMPYAFEPERPATTLGEVISTLGLAQFHDHQRRPNILCRQKSRLEFFQASQSLHEFDSIIPGRNMLWISNRKPTGK